MKEGTTCCAWTEARTLAGVRAKMLDAFTTDAEYCGLTEASDKEALLDGSRR